MVASDHAVVGFSSSLDHLLAELHAIDLLIRAQVGRARRRQDNNEYAGLFISEHEVDALLERPCGLPPWAGQGPDGPDLPAVMAGFRSAIERGKAESLKRGVPLRLERLRELFSLDERDVGVLLVCLAAELDLRYEKLYAYLHDDVTRKRPSVDLVSNLLCSTFEEKVEMRRRWFDGSPLIDHQIVTFSEDPSQPDPPLLRRAIRVDDRVVDFLLEMDQIDRRLRSVVRVEEPRSQLDDVLLPEETKARFVELLKPHGAAPGTVIFYLEGPAGTGRRSTAEALCRLIGRRLLSVDGERLSALGGAEWPSMVALVRREADLQDAVIFWRGFDVLLADDKKAALSELLGQLQARAGVSFLAGTLPWEPGEDTQFQAPFLRVPFEFPDARQRGELWGRALRSAVCSNDVDLDDISNRFRLSGGRIRAAASTARSLAQWRDASEPTIGMEDLLSACRVQSKSRLGTLARKIDPHYRWEDIVLPADRLQQLREISCQFRYRSQVYGEWGFDRKLAMGKGLNMLFAGPSGTGKTMAADIMAGELGLGLYKIDLSSVVSKYIGETEKNLSRIFAEAATANAVLFFDEADALFGKRSEVRNSHDRYANIETGYLLQRMEEYDSVAILATNLRKNMDDTFVRRMHATVEFPFPDERHRLAIWRRIWPDAAPRENDLDLEFLASRLEITGGNIRNIALAAAFLAAQEGSGVAMRHLIRGTQREYQKMGKVVIGEEFKPYASLMGGEEKQSDARCSQAVKP